ncbi:unnamed protein product, partial [Linum tenue]
FPQYLYSSSLFLLLPLTLHSPSLLPYLFFSHFPLISSQDPSDKEIRRMSNKLVELKVGLHCDECIKKILKAIKKIQDIETYNVDTQLNKVTVTGNVTTVQVIRVIHKIGKTATNWDDEERQLQQQF